MANQWIITKDIIEDGAAEGTTSAIFKDNIKMPVRFKLFDDDQELYLVGRMEKEDFNLLDELGRGYGCTEIKTSKNGKPFTTL